MMVAVNFAAVLPRDIQYKYFHSDLHNGQFIAKCDTFRQGTIRRKLDSLHVNLESLLL